MKKPTVVLDTNIVSYALKRDTRILKYVNHLAKEVPAVSFFTIAELYRWSILYRWQGPKRGRLNARINSYRVIHSNDEICRIWAELNSLLGQMIEHGDGWIAATALANKLPLVTHNRRHFDHIPGLELISEA